MTSRRTVLASITALLSATTLTGQAQTTKVPRIAFLSNAGPITGRSQVDAFRRGLRELGWIEGQTAAIEYRYAEGDLDRLPGLVEELVRTNVDVIVLSGPRAMSAAQKATTTIPVVFVLLIDPVATGYVHSLARPGGNMTGLASQFEELITKQLQLLKEATPQLVRVALLRHIDGSPAIRAAAEAAARGLGLETSTITVASERDLERAFRQARAERVGAIHVLPSPYLGAHRARVIELAAQYRLPACYELRIYVQDGGLMSYGPSIDDLYGRSAHYVHRILKGANPGELAIERPARFEFVINRKTAAALGLAIPQSLLRQVDEVIE